MNKYVKLKDVLHILDLVITDDSIKHTGKVIRKRLKELPTADVAEVKPGKWETGRCEGGIFDGMNFEKCSVCQFERLFEDVSFKTTFKYCPNCGAKMDKEEGAEECA